MAHAKEKHVNLIIGKLYDQMKKVVYDTDDDPKKERNIILYTGAVYLHMIEAIRKFQKREKKKFRIGLIHDSKGKLNEDTEGVLDKLDLVLSCDTGSDTALQKTLLPYQDEILTVSCRSENYIPLLKRVLPQVPYVEGPTSEALKWSTDKILMRERMDVYNKNINPRFTVITDDSKESLNLIEEKVGFPLIAKPSGLAASRLVSICFHREELEEVLKRTFKKLEGAYKEHKYEDMGKNGKETRLLVEQFIEGEMHSIDAYVNATGEVWFCPMVHVKTGKEIGFDDFFGYQQMTPATLNEVSVQTAQIAALSAIRAVGLRSCTVHVEMMKTEGGWKIIEMAPRPGGFRHMMYEFSYDINHTVNDVLVRTGDKPIIPKKLKGYAVAMKFFAKQEGKLFKLQGIKKAQELKSLKKLYVHKKVGDQCTYAKHGGSSVFDLIMFNKDRSELLADIRRLEKMIDIETE